MPGHADPPQAAHANRRRADRLLFERYRAAHDPALRDQLVERFLPLAKTIAARFSRPGGGPSDDVYQVACLGLVKAVDRFDPALGTAFSTFAVPTISGEVRRYFRDLTWSVRPPRFLMERALRVEGAALELTECHGRSPTVGQVARHLGDLDTEQVLDAREARQAMTAASLQGRVGDEDDAATREESIGEADEGYARADDRATLQRLLRSLSPRERDVLFMRYVQDMTQAEIGRQIGVSQMQISRIVRGALTTMHLVAERDAAATHESVVHATAE